MLFRCLFGLLLLCPFAFSCGVTQHNLIAHKAFGWFDPASQVDQDFGVFLEILQDNQDSFQCGAAFPDWGYTCGESDASEMAHWPPFTLAYTTYFLKECGHLPGNWTSDCQKLVSFLFGIVSHQVSDVLWHDLAIVDPTQQGFIQAMANTDFEGNYGDAHGVADAGGEFIVAHEFDLSFIQREWYLPAPFLSSLYKALNHDISEDKLIECNLLLYAEVHAVKEGGSLLYPYATRKSAFLTDRILDYWMGGIDDNAIWTLWCWYDYLMSWMTSSNGSISQYPLCLAQQPLFGDCPDVCTAYSPMSNELISLSHHLINKTTSLRVDASQRGIHFSHSSEFAKLVKESISIYFPVQEKQEKPYDDVQQRATNNEACEDSFTDLPMFMGSVPNSYTSWSFSSGDLNHDGIDDVIVGAPGWSNDGSAQLGGVYVLHGNSSLQLENNQTLPTKPSILGSNAHDRFGWASIVVDLNKDGWNDLIVSSPGNSANNLTYRGLISVFWGTNGTLSSQADLIIRSNTDFTGLGYSFFKYDCDSDGYEDVLIGAPYAGSGTSSPQQTGKVFLLLATHNFNASSPNNDLFIEDLASWTMRGLASNNLFGSQIQVVQSEGRGNPIVIVGAPVSGSGSFDDRELGAVYGYDLQKLMRNNDQQSSFIFMIEGEDIWDQVGTSFSVGSFADYPFVLAVSAPGRKTGFQEEQFGAVFFYDLSSLQGNHSLYGETNILVLQGDEKYARYGYHCHFDGNINSANSSWWISQPRRNYDLENPEAGAVFRWESSHLPLHPRDPQSADGCWLASFGRIRFGESLYFADINGNGINDVFIGSPRWGASLVGAFSLLLR